MIYLCALMTEQIDKITEVPHQKWGVEKCVDKDFNL